MIRPTTDQPQDLASLPEPKIRKKGWSVPLIWMVPLLAAGLAAYYGYLHFQEKGQDVVIKFTDGSGLKEGETMVTHLGVEIGKVSGIELSDDKKQVRVHVDLHRSQEAFAKEGAVYWTVRPQVSVENISGLNTVLSGPYIEANPGSGARATEFDGLQKAPIDRGPGVNFVLHAPRIDHLSPEASIYYRGIEVGTIKDVRLGNDASSVDVGIFIRHRYSSLVQTDSKFWLVKAADIKGGLFSGLQFKLGSLQSLVSGGVAFATPPSDVSLIAREGTTFPLYDDVNKDWLEWSPRIPLEPDDAKPGDKSATLPQTPNAARSLVN